jgi:hypothetical protein
MHSVSVLLTSMLAPGWSGIFPPCELCGDKLQPADDYRQQTYYWSDTWLFLSWLWFPFVYFAGDQKKKKREDRKEDS